MNTGKQQKPVLTGQRFKTRKRGELCYICLRAMSMPNVHHVQYVGKTTDSVKLQYQIIEPVS